MNKYIYQLQIVCLDKEQRDRISDLLKAKPTKQMGNTWCLEIEEKENDDYFDFINHFLGLLNDKYEQLEIARITKEDISIGLLYAYNDQCNIEFSPNDLKRLGESGIRFCISCWQS